MRLIKALLPAWGVALALALFCLWARAHLPDSPLAVHFDARFRPDGFWSRDRALAWPPLMAGALLVVLTAGPFVLPPKGALQRSAPAYGAVCAAIMAFLALVEVGVVARAFGWRVDLPQLLAAGMGCLFLVMGNFMSKVRYNMIFGVRTPWTLANESVWDRTHRLAAPLFMLAGAGLVAAAVFAPGALRIAVFAAVLAPTVISIAYSYVLWSRLPESEKGQVRGGA